jgi:hypothetical protein
VTFYTADICTWQFPQKYDLISAWDSTFHLPLAEQKPVLKKMCDGLQSKGAVLFTCGGTIGPEEISGGFEGQTFDYSTLGVKEFLRLTAEFGCTCKHVEYDQYPENHVYIIAQKVQQAFNSFLRAAPGRDSGILLVLTVHQDFLVERVGLISVWTVVHRL